MSSVRNAVQRKNHKERGQLSSRSRLGLLEKHKDYVLRAKDYHSKEKAIKGMREKAAARNPDEFYFKMINTSTKGGVHVASRAEAFSPEEAKLLKSQDIGYIKHRRNMERNKIERLKESLSFMEDAGNRSAKGQKKSNHTVFVDTEEEASNLDVAKHLNTPAELLGRRANRPRTADLQNQTSLETSTSADLTSLRKERTRAYRELSGRMKREATLKALEQELMTQKNLMDKGGVKKKVGKDSRGLGIYKWNAERKR
ncbi:small-subunit processome [Piptocephalis cylindrospora]|uniref:U3 small nucleolar RNA-associated protein 11 n=1 Tax=Piptocephalis cylindrospora TaxID=1907219 RepID=A0A4P9Y7N5_9FUNG|nr:small-subunit processome [Piptocephalis cylindrospora]|eukprot:RKP14281.1 small-subunit processome [Piptocephalis cylindrospora]